MLFRSAVLLYRRQPWRLARMAKYCSLLPHGLAARSGHLVQPAGKQDPQMQVLAGESAMHCPLSCMSIVRYPTVRYHTKVWADTGFSVADIYKKRISASLWTQRGETNPTESLLANVQLLKE